MRVDVSNRADNPEAVKASNSPPLKTWGLTKENDKFIVDREQVLTS